MVIRGHQWSPDPISGHETRFRRVSYASSPSVVRRLAECRTWARRVSYVGSSCVVRRRAECRTPGRRVSYGGSPAYSKRPKTTQNHPKTTPKPPQRSSCTDSNRGWRMPSFSPQRFFNPATEEFKVLSDDHYTTRALSTIPPPQMCPLYAQFLRLPISPRRYKLLIRATLGPHQATQARRADLSLKRRTNRRRFLVQDESSAPPPPRTRAQTPRRALARGSHSRTRSLARDRSLARSRTPRQHAGRAGRRRGV